MKRILLLILLLSACSHFQTKQQIAQGLIKKYLDSTLNDPHSYESVSFTKLDTGKTSYTETPEYDVLDSSITSIHDSLITERVDVNYPSLYNTTRIVRKIRKLMQDSLLLDSKLNNLQNQFKPIQNCWFISHTYRAKNGFGALGLHTTIFKIDTNLSKVSNVVDSKD